MFFALVAGTPENTILSKKMLLYRAAVFHIGLIYMPKNESKCSNFSNFEASEKLISI